MLSVPEAIEDLVAMKRLWVHEVLRVYYDRLVEDVDRAFINDILHSIMKSVLREDLDEVFKRIASPNSTIVNWLLLIMLTVFSN